MLISLHVRDQAWMQTHRNTHRKTHTHMMQRKWLIFIILSGSDRDPAVFLLKTSCRTRERQRGREGYKQDGVDDVIYNGKEKHKIWQNTRNGTSLETFHFSMHVLIIHKKHFSFNTHSPTLKVFRILKLFFILQRIICVQLENVLIVATKEWKWAKIQNDHFLCPNFMVTSLQFM